MSIIIILIYDLCLQPLPGKRLHGGDLEYEVIINTQQLCLPKFHGRPSLKDWTNASSYSYQILNNCTSTVSVNAMNMKGYTHVKPAHITIPQEATCKYPTYVNMVIIVVVFHTLA